ncbi:LacI family DNA-binding transcriptional regulator [Paenibacillus spongiae]|uniref:LacI family transcriptional regulator n=1 Tax=Paenibacillus spongiae TaxID=2909671 RepID=A0ABY5SBG5_9BACL|nr:LacI family DNA-binding transcriptional regulator [Paenibacillus spongiae]UVI31262.1 LacI family transcriptional regulator [Paenibacillus spongiae]
MATIDDVAKAAGVSKSTVSSVFSRKRPISKEVTERVLVVANQLNYKPNFWARTLTNKTTNIIGLNMQGEKIKFSQFHLTLMNGVLKECYDHGYRLLVNTLSGEYLSQVEHLSSNPVDGEILLDPSQNDPRISELVLQEHPLVVIGRPSFEFESRICYVDNDNLHTAQKVTEYLLELGHRRILFLNASRSRTVSEDRANGYLRAFKKLKLTSDSNLIVYKDDALHSAEYGYFYMKQMMSASHGITAVITDSDKVALGIYQGAKEMNISIPSDLSVFAFSNDSIFAHEFTPSLSGVRLNGETLGSAAAKLLIDQLKQGEQIATRILIPTELIIRDSCGPIKPLGGNY